MEQNEGLTLMGRTNGTQSLPCPQAISAPPLNASRTSEAVVQLGTETCGDNWTSGICPLSTGLMATDTDTNCFLFPRLRSRLPKGMGMQNENKSVSGVYVCLVQYTPLNVTGCEGASLYATRNSPRLA